MKIIGTDYTIYDLELVEPYSIAYETIDSCRNVHLQLITDKGIIGHGLAAPDMAVTSEQAEDVVDNINKIIDPLVRGEHPLQIERFLKEAKEQKIGKTAMAAMDIALYDILAKCANQPLFRLLGGYRNQIFTSVTIGIMPILETITAANKIVKKGYKCIKIKGGLSVEEDIEKVRKVRESIGNSIHIRFDANQGYSLQEAVRFFHSTKQSDIQIFEQPTQYNDLSLLKSVTNAVAIPVMADEGIRSMRDAFLMTSQGAVDMVSVKLQKVGGISEAMHINSISKSDDLEVMVSCLDECSLGIAAGLHFALGRPNVEFADLDSHLDIVNDPFSGLFSIENGLMKCNDKPGIGL